MDRGRLAVYAKIYAKLSYLTPGYNFIFCSVRVVSIFSFSSWKENNKCIPQNVGLFPWTIPQMNVGISNDGSSMNRCLIPRNSVHEPWIKKILSAVRLFLKKWASKFTVSQPPFLIHRLKNIYPSKKIMQRRFSKTHYLDCDLSHRIS